MVLLRFGLPRPALASSLSTQVNVWQEDWVTFYARQRIQPQMDMVEKGSGDREALELWSALQVRGALPCKPDRGGPEAGGVRLAGA